MSPRISFACDYCGKALSVKAEYAGRRGKCKGCGNSLEVPRHSNDSNTDLEGNDRPAEDRVNLNLKTISRDDVFDALEEIDEGLEHGFARSSKYALIIEGRHYSPKAVVGVAHKVATGRLLTPRDFSGGNEAGQANYVLRTLGFQVKLIDVVQGKGLGVREQSHVSESGVVLAYLTSKPFQTLNEISQATWIAEGAIKEILLNDLAASVGKTMDWKWALRSDLNSYEPPIVDSVDAGHPERDEPFVCPEDFHYHSLEEKINYLRQIYASDDFLHLGQLRLRALTTSEDRHLPQIFLSRKVSEFLDLSVDQISREPGVGETKIQKIIEVLLRALESSNLSTPLSVDEQGPSSGAPKIGNQSQTNDYSKLPIEPVTLGQIAGSLEDVPRNSLPLDVSMLLGVSEGELTEMPGIGSSKAQAVLSEVEEVEAFLDSGDRDSEFCLILCRREIQAIEDWCFELVGSDATPSIAEFRLRFVAPILKLIERDFNEEMLQIVESRIGLNYPSRTLQEICEDYDVTRERVRQKLVKVAEAIQMRFPRGKTLLALIASVTEHSIECADVNQLIREFGSTIFSTERVDKPDRPSAKEVLGAWTKLGREHSTPFSHAELIQWISEQFPGIVDSFAFELIASDALVTRSPNGKTIFLTNRVEDRAYAHMVNSSGKVTLDELSDELETNDRSLKVALATDQRLAMDDDHNIILLEDIGFKRHEGKWFLNLHPIQDSPDLDNEVIIPVETIVNCVLNGMSGKGIFDATVWGVYRFVNELLEYEYRSTFPMGLDEIILADVLVAHSKGQIRNMRRRRLRWDDNESPVAKGKNGWVASYVNQANMAITVDELDELLRESFQDYANYVLEQIKPADDEDGDSIDSFEVVKIPRIRLPLIATPENGSYTGVENPCSPLVAEAISSLSSYEMSLVANENNAWLNAALSSDEKPSASSISELQPESIREVQLDSTDEQTSKQKGSSTLQDVSGIPNACVSMVESVYKVLVDNGEPMKISNIRQRLNEIGVQIPGQGKDANIIVYVRKSSDFCRTALGTYALTEWGLPTIDKPKVGWKREKKTPNLTNGKLRPEGVDKLLHAVAEPSIEEPMQIYEAALKVLHELGEPTHISEIRESIETKGYFQFGAQNPEGALRVAIDRHANNVEISRPAEPTLFYRHAPATYGLIEWQNQDSIENSALDPLSIVSRMGAETWFALSHWAKGNDKLQPKERSLAYSVGKVLSKGNMPSSKQAKWAVDILGIAEAAGFDANAIEPKLKVAYEPPKSNLRTDSVNDVLASFILGE